jgi:serine/threonine protein kinase
MNTRKNKVTKENNVTKKNKTRSQRAGIRLEKQVSHTDAFKFFIENSTFSYFNRGFFGILVLAKLNEGIQSPYRHIRTNSIKKVNYLLLKFFEIKPPSTDLDIKNIDSTDIQREIKIQQQIYMSSLIHPDTLLEPICPCIVYSHAEALTNNCKQSFYKILNRSIQNNKHIDKLFQGENNVAFFAMEFMENYSPLSKYIDTYLGTSAIDKSLYILDKLHLLGFMHNDFHTDNVLFINNYNYFNIDKENSNGRAILIDFGLTNKIKIPDKKDYEKRIKLLQRETSYAHDMLLAIFKWLDDAHQRVQKKHIEIFEKNYKCDISKIINSFNIYIGGNMSIPDSKFKPRFHKRINKKITEDAEEELKRVNPEKYKELIDSIMETLEEEKKQPGYFKALCANQSTNLIDPAFKLRVENDDPDKLRLILDE